MSEQIKNLVLRHVPAAYRGQREVDRAVEGVTAEIVRLRDNAAANIRSAARRKGISDNEVNEFLYGAGLAERPAPRPAPAATQATEGGSLTAAVRSLEQTINGLATFARQHGYRG